MRRKDAIPYLRAMKAIMKDANKASETLFDTIAAFECAITSMEKLDELEAWLKAQQADLAGRRDQT